MFGSRGESRRIDKGVALGRPIYSALGLESDFDAAVKSIRHCLLIRNQYSHHTFWDDNTGKLAIGNLENIARLPEKQSDLLNLIPNHVTVDLLQEQGAYFRFADGLLIWVNFEGRFRRGMLNTNPVPKPSPIPKPMLHL